MIYAKVLQSDERRCALSRLSKITHEFLTATGLPYAVSDAPPLKRFGPTGLRVSYDVEWVEFYYPHQREWWKFDTALDDNVTLEPERSMFTKTTDWPLTLPLWILSDLIEGCRSSLYPRDPRLIADLEDASPEEIAVVEDLQEKGLLLLRLTIDGRMRLNTKAVTPLATQLLQRHTIPGVDTFGPGVKPTE